MKHRRNFSLIEFAVVMAIIGILIGLVLGAGNIAGRKASYGKTTARLNEMKIALEQHRQDRGFYPEQVGGELNFTDFVDSDTGRPYLDGYSGGFFKDAWGNPFYYECPGTMRPESFDLWSLGPDGRHGDGGDLMLDAQTMEDNDDVTNWKKE